MRPTARQRITPSEIAVAVAVLVLPPLVIGGVLYASLAPFDDNAAVQHGAFTAAASPIADPAADAAAGPATDSGISGHPDRAPVDDVTVRAAPVTTSATTPAAAATPPAAPPPKRSVRRRAQRPPPQDDFPQKMKSWFENVARDVGVLPRDGAAADAGR